MRRVHTHGDIRPRFHLCSLMPAEFGLVGKTGPVDRTIDAHERVRGIVPQGELAGFLIRLTVHLIEKGVWRHKSRLIRFPVRDPAWGPAWHIGEVVDVGFARTPGDGRELVGRKRGYVSIEGSADLPTAVRCGEGDDDGIHTWRNSPEACQFIFRRKIENALRDELTVLFRKVV